MADFRVETDRLIVRDWAGDADWDAFLRHTNTPAVMEWLGGLLDAEGERKQRQRVEECRALNHFCFWLVERKDDGGHLSGEVLGFCGMKRSNQEGGPQGEFEIGWRFRADSWGHGYAREAAIAVRDAAFEIFAAPSIIALTVPENAASWGLMLRLGMKRDEALDFASAAFGSDTIIAYSLDRADWEALR
ncbi:GNAT family N-acetyltransferase [Alteraurantiacibacter aestuarii]|uniref:GNAT family N-acetyltransferase n=1 Tax=Alteraurantiacibacter aestuarii TaxID=650004 RepID=A0A844ZM07_9SPHN|nr:GNAT family N-acetyltransferase [Alteraurantiacibacter aestuarii]MXO88623.1 GNAT family N-acetyltransferase [Alteraurantiacibacter aestuarii]